MSDQSKLGLGQIITTEQHRDAIHIAVAPVVAGERLFPGDQITLDAKQEAHAVPSGVEGIGVVDPFLMTRVNEGEHFWVYLKPGSITSLRHEWTHPAFAVEIPAHGCTDPEGESLRWLQEFAGEWNMRFNEMIERAESGEGLVVQGRDAHSWGDSGATQEEFILHFERYTGKKFTGDREEFYFSCSC